APQAAVPRDRAPGAPGRPRRCVGTARRGRIRRLVADPHHPAAVVERGPADRGHHRRPGGPHPRLPAAIGRTGGGGSAESRPGRGHPVRRPDPMTVLLVVLGAAVGAPLRYLADRAIQARDDSVFPWGTFTVNVAGSFILGVLVRGASVHAVPGSLVSLLGTGLCGALTTYSTFGYEIGRASSRER